MLWRRAGPEGHLRVMLIVMLWIWVMTTAAVAGASSAPSQSIEHVSGFAELLGFLIPLALTDSVNPCTFALYATLLISISVSESRGRVALAGVAFIAAVMTGYLALGLGLSTFASLIPRGLVVAVAFAYAAFIIYRSVRDLRGTAKQDVCREGDPECKAGRLLRVFPVRGGIGVLASFVIGLLASFTLLPCSAGPYMVFAMVISTQSLIEKLALLLAYNVVFVTPLILILVAVLGITRLGRVKDKLVRYSPQISLLGGILLVIVVTLMVLQS